MTILSSRRILFHDSRAPGVSASLPRRLGPVYTMQTGDLVPQGGRNHSLTASAGAAPKLRRACHQFLQPRRFHRPMLRPCHCSDPLLRHRLMTCRTDDRNRARGGQVYAVRCALVACFLLSDAVAPRLPAIRTAPVFSLTVGVMLLSHHRPVASAPTAWRPPMGIAAAWGARARPRHCVSVGGNRSHDYSQCPPVWLLSTRPDYAARRDQRLSLRAGDCLRAADIPAQRHASRPNRFTNLPHHCADSSAVEEMDPRRHQQPCLSPFDATSPTRSCCKTGSRRKSSASCAQRHAASVWPTRSSGLALLVNRVPRLARAQGTPGHAAAAMAIFDCRSADFRHVTVAVIP